MSETKHTPLPWKINKNLGTLYDANGKRICTSPYNTPHDLANLETIKLACSCHDDLLAVCKLNADTFRETAQVLRLLKHDVAAEAMGIAEDATRAAIAKAKQ